MKGLKKIMGKGMTLVMLSCDKATFLLTKKEIGNITFIEVLKLKIHLLSCKYCHRFAQQSTFITKQIHSLSIIDPNNLKLKLTDEQKICMQHNIDNQLSKK